jgi:peptidoglycan hydrolase-like protein with peptidoglycan-binding domain
MMSARTILAGGAATLAAGAVAVVGLLWIQSGHPAAAPSAAPIATAEVIRGTLLDIKTVTGTLGYGELSSLRPSLTDDSAMVTWIAPVGSTVERGEPLYTLDGQPAILFYGSDPQHRTLRFDEGTESPVWVELETAVTAVEAAELRLTLEQERLNEAKTRTVDVSIRLEDALSATPTMPEFIQLSGAVRAAEAKVDRVTELSAAELAPTIEIAAAEAELAIASSAFDAATRALRENLAAARLDAVTARVAVAEAEARLDQLSNTLEALVARASDNADVGRLADNLAALGYEGTLAEQVRAWQHAAGLPVTGIVGPSQLVVADGPVHVAQHSASVGETLVESSPDRRSILDYSSTEKLVTVPLDVGDHALAAIGRTVTVTLPDDTEVEGTISEVGSVVTEGAIEVIIAVADQAALGGLEVASVDVEFVSEGRDDVLSVPVAALLARSEGGFAIEMVTDGTSTLVPVETGLFAAGRVEISGEAIAEGMLVGVPG